VTDLEDTTRCEDISGGAQDAPEQDTDERHPYAARKGVGLGTVFLFSGIAAGTGTIGGYLLSKHMAFQTDIAQYEASANALKTQIEDINSDLRAWTTRMNLLDTELQSLKSRPTPALSEDGFSDIITRLDALETRVTTFGGATPEPGLTVMPDTPATGADIIKSLQTRLADLTTRIEILETTGLDVTAMKTELTTLQTRIGTIASNTSKQFTSATRRIGAIEEQIEDMVKSPSAHILPPFPREAVLTALSRPGHPGQGWFSRALGKHVVIRDDGAIAMVENIESLIARGDITSALEMTNDWPESARNAAKDWISAAHSAVN